MVVVDALLGTGVRGELRDPVRAAVEVIRSARAARVPVVAVDTPTARRPDVGRPVRPRRQCRPDGDVPPARRPGLRTKIGARAGGQGARRADRDPVGGGSWLRSASPACREVLLVAAVAVAVVLLAAGLTALLPREGQSLVFHTPLLIVVLVARHRPRALADRPRAEGRPTLRVRGRALLSRPVVPPLDRRSAALDGSPASASTCSSSAAGSSARGAARRDEPGPARALVEQHDIASGTSRGPVAADPRRPALPRAAALRAGLRGARGAGPAAAAGAPPRDPRAVPVPDLRHPAGPPGLLRQRHLPVRPARRAARAAASRSTSRPSSAIDYAPDLRRKGLTGGIVYHDGVEDDARLALAVLGRRLPAAPSPRRASGRERPLLDGERLIGRRCRGCRDGDDPRGPGRTASSTPPASGQPTPRPFGARSTVPTRSSRVAARTS